MAMVCREETAGGDRPTWPIEGKWWEDKSFHLWICCSSVFNSLSCPVLNLVGESRGLSSSVEMLRVEDEESQNSARDLRAPDSTIREIADKLSETAEAAESITNMTYNHHIFLFI
ncbi:hypothetical protein V6N11_051282 [Hibiscus sabdariffa]|uniref:Uncharacterized protein n=2 Tax=Hibiscus sabdariffa TaxID=183260 RepID=A0ABR2AEB1_9ROSI